VILSATTALTVVLIVVAWVSCEGAPFSAYGRAVQSVANVAYECILIATCCLGELQRLSHLVSQSYPLPTLLLRMYKHLLLLLLLLLL
jgi:hypothetical protein